MRASFILSSMLLCACGEPQPSEPRPPSPWPHEAWARTSPEAQGIDSDALAEVVAHARQLDLGLHALLVVRHGAIVLDVKFHPYTGQRPHDIASCTKSLTSIAVGLAHSRGDIATLDAPLVSFFPEHSIAGDSPDKRAITLEHALTMTTGLQCIGAAEATLRELQASSDWIAAALDLPMAAAPGDRFEYCSPVSHLLSGVVQASSGRSADALLAEHVFAPIGIAEVVWPHDPSGVAHGWGDARMWPEDMARLGLLLLHEGRWDGARVLDRDWVRAATSNRIGDLAPDGYGYQFWPADGGGFRASGRGGQFILVQPALDLVVVTTGASSPVEIEAYGELLESDLLPAIVSKDPLPENEQAAAHLLEEVEAAARPPAAEPVPPIPALASMLQARTFTAAENLLGWDTFGLSFEDTRATLEVGIDGASFALAVGLDGVPHVNAGVRFSADPRHADADVALAGRWLDDRTFEVEFDTIDRIDAGTVTFAFGSDAVTVALREKTLLGEAILFGAH